VPILRVALTGTPGVGKTTVAQAAAIQGWNVVDVKAWAKRAGAVVGHDEQDAADVIDVDALAIAMPPDAGRTLFDGHLSHLLPVDVAWVLRCDPRILGDRLAARGYPAAKILENLEAEALDIILQEALEHGARVIQRDGTRRSPAALLKSFADATAAPSKGHDLEPIDWSGQLPIKLR